MTTGAGVLRTAELARRDGRGRSPSVAVARRRRRPRRTRSRNLRRRSAPRSWRGRAARTRAGAPTPRADFPDTDPSACALPAWCSRLSDRVTRAVRPADRSRRAADVGGRAALAEDLTPLGDLTPRCSPPSAGADAAFVARQRRACSPAPLRHRGVPPGRPARRRVDVGGRRRRRGRRRRTTLGRRSTGRWRSILTAERTALNFLGHLSGVATLTRRFVDAAARAAAAIWDTRKTTPGLRALEKAAVRAGGGAQPPGQPVRVGPAQGQPPRRAVGITDGRGAGPAGAGRPAPSQVECDRLEQVAGGGRRPAPTSCCSTT